jgi:hypothetical protein
MAGIRPVWVSNVSPALAKDNSQISITVSDCRHQGRPCVYLVEMSHADLYSG